MLWRGDGWEEEEVSGGRGRGGGGGGGGGLNVVVGFRVVGSNTTMRTEGRVKIWVALKVTNYKWVIIEGRAEGAGYLLLLTCLAVFLWVF